MTWVAVLALNEVVGLASIDQVKIQHTIKISQLTSKGM